jgi:S-adenosylmethionine:tRNA ribosyltransferase-isomerase
MQALRTNDFDYHLPEELIASHPPERRDAGRMLIVDRQSGKVEHARFSDFPSLVNQDDLLVLNDTRVVRSRFFSDDGKIEIVKLEAADATTWKCLVRPGKKMREGKSTTIGGIAGTVQEVLDKGERIIKFDAPVDIERHGQLALPHYMGRESEIDDLTRYQTVYAENDGAIAAPTAGLHFTEEILSNLNHTAITLHVGVGTFAPVKADFITEHEMHSERYEISETAAEMINATRGRKISIGTTVTRVLEHAFPLVPHRGETNIFIYPPYKFRQVDALLTNFHLPKSTLLMLISAFAGKELIEEAYAKAIEARYRFYSYGDCMFIQ